MRREGTERSRKGEKVTFIIVSGGSISSQVVHVFTIIFHILRILLYDWFKVNHVMKDSSPIIDGGSKKFVTLCR